MTLAAQPYRIVESSVRRVLGGFQFVDATTRLPIAAAITLEVRSATVGEPPAAVAVDETTVRIRRNRRGVYAVSRAPLFDGYTMTFVDPAAPAETQTGPLRLRLGAIDAGPSYLPQAFEFDVPRSIDPHDADTVFVPQQVPLVRAPAAPVQDGWALLRVRVTRTGTNPPEPVPGVLLRVFRTPRDAADAPIGIGMTDWRGGVAGEALAPLPGLQRFRPGAGPHVIETDYAIELDATRDPAFTGAARQLPDPARLADGTADGLIRPPGRPPASELTLVSPGAVPRVAAGREYTLHLSMP